jgi:CDP-glucose 4,6-dehydratase
MGRKFWQNKTVLITGYAGFLGSWLTKILLEKGAKVIGLDLRCPQPKSIINDIGKEFITFKGDVADPGLVKNIINKHKPAYIFHLAAEAIVGRAYYDPIKTFQSNIEGTWNVLEACRGKGFIKGLVVASSDKAYGNQKKLPYAESTPLQGVNPYDVSKSCADLLAISYHHSYKIPVCVTRCGNIFGPGDLNFSRLIPDAVLSALNNKSFVIRSDGKYTRDYIYIEDIVRGYIMLAEKIQKLKLYGQAFNFSNEEPVTVLELIRMIYKLCGRAPSYKILNQAQYEIKHQYLSSRKAKKMLGWKADFKLEEALVRTINWYGQNF